MGTADVKANLEDLLRGLAAGTVEPEDDPPEAARPYLDDLLSRADTYRDGR